MRRFAALGAEGTIPSRLMDWKRDKTITGKELRIHDLRKQNQELEKFKNVSEFKIKELKAKIDPRMMPLRR